MKKIKVAFIGCGRISDLHYLGYINNPDAELYAICDPSSEVLEKREKEWNVTKTYTDYKELLKDENVDAVEIITPQHTHAEIAIAALKAKKHVSMQKPMTPTVEAAEAILEESKKHKDVIFRVFDNFLFYPPIVFAKQLLDDGVIGEPENIRMKMIAWNDSAGWEVPPGAWEWRVQENKSRRPRQTWDHGQHLWSTAWHLMGEFDKVKSWIDYNDDGSIDSPAMIMWRHKGKRKMGMCEYTYSDEIKFPTRYYSCDEWVEITGPKGMIKINGCSGDTIGQPAVSVFSSNGWKDYTDLDTDWASSFVNGTKAFINSVKGVENPYLTLEDGIKILKFSFAIQDSDKLGREVVL